MITPEIGVRFAVAYEITRSVERGEIWEGRELTNERGDLWWARPVFSPHMGEILVCLDRQDQKYFDAAKVLETDQVCVLPLPKPTP